MSGKLLVGLAVLGLFMCLPIFRDMHHQGQAQSGWSLLWDQLVMKERAKHISVEEAVINAKARYMLSIIPEGQ